MVMAYPPDGWSHLSRRSNLIFTVKFGYALVIGTYVYREYLVNGRGEKD
jgi:hypothetical protein